MKYLIKSKNFYVIIILYRKTSNVSFGRLLNEKIL